MRIIKTHQKVYQRSLARAGGPYYGDHAAWRGNEVYVAEYEPAFIVAKVDMRYIHLPMLHLKRLCIRQIGSLLLFI